MTTIDPRNLLDMLARDLRASKRQVIAGHTDHAHRHIAYSHTLAHLTHALGDTE